MGSENGSSLGFLFWGSFTGSGFLFGVPCWRSFKGSFWGSLLGGSWVAISRAYPNEGYNYSFPLRVGERGPLKGSLLGSLLGFRLRVPYLGFLFGFL